MKPRVVAFVDHEIGFRVLEKMLNLSSLNKIDVLAVVTTTDNGKMWWPGVEEQSLNSGIRLIRYEESFSEIDLLPDADWFFLISWKHVLPPFLVGRPSNGVINLHYSLLPDYRGVYPVNWAVIEGKEKTGVTYHFVNNEIDAGPIILQRDLEIFSSDTARTLQLRLDDLACELFDELMEGLLCGNLRGGNHCAVHGEYKSRKAFNEKREIDLNLQYSGKEFLNLLRGLTFFENGKNAFFFDAQTGEKIYINVLLKREGQ
ncbi:formyltransferase family protein [Chitiniphilus shinanonensis]|uniref:formyltransferase family protein n=1 Tax=Chitiniphilus shinanonensis TaxID=553088 RepID=UPI00333ED300